MYQMLRTFLLPNARCWDADSERSYQTLFERLDTNKDGKVDVAELRAGLKAMGIFRLGAAQVQPEGPGGPVQAGVSGLGLLGHKFLNSVTVACCVCVDVYYSVFIMGTSLWGQKVHTIHL